MNVQDDNKNIKLPDGREIKWFAKDVDNYIDKTTLIFGGSGSGKTTLIDEILYIIKDHISNYIVIAPKTSDDVYKRKLPPKCIKEDLTKEKLQEIWRRQYYLTEVYNIANDSKILETLFNKISDRPSYLMIELLKRKAKEIIVKIEEEQKLSFGEKRSRKLAIENLRDKKIKTVYKDTIRKNGHILSKMSLSHQENIALEYLDVNPRMCIVIDDCSDKFVTWIKYFKKQEVNPFESIFYRGRWNYITLIFASHDDKIVPPELRKNARVTIYANSQALVASLNKQQSGFSSDEKKLAMRIASCIFGEEKNGTKKK